MKWLNMETKTRTAPEFVGAEPSQRATWLCLMLYCAEHETGGNIHDCSEWGDRRWMQTCGVTKAEIHESSALWSWKGKTLVVWGYPVDQERIISAKRVGGRSGGKRSGWARQKAAREASGEGCGEGELKPFHEALLERKGKEREGKEREPSGEGSFARAQESIPKPPTIEEVRAVAATIGMTDADAQEFFDFWQAAGWVNRNGVPLRNFKAAMASRKSVLAEKKALAKAGKGQHNGQGNRRGRAAVTQYQAPGKPYAQAF